MLIEPMTWDYACAWVLEPTEIGYTQKSQDKLWVVASIEDREDGWTDDYPELLGNPIYLYVDGKTCSYELWDNGACFTSRRDAEQWIKQTDAERSWQRRWYTVNYGDGHRFENAYFAGEIAYDGDGFKPKYRGSDAFYARHTEVYKQIDDNLRRTGKRGPIT